MIKNLKTACLTILCLHNQLFASEVARALGAFDTQLRQLTKTLEGSELATETLPGAERSRDLENMLQMLAEKERREFEETQRWRTEHEAAIAQQEGLRQLWAEERKQTVEREKQQEEKEREKQQQETLVKQQHAAKFSKEAMALIEKEFARIKKSNTMPDIRRWNLYLRDVKKTFAEHSSLQADLTKAGEKFPLLSEQERKEIVATALIDVMGREEAVPENSLTMGEIRGREAYKLKVSEQAKKRGGEILKATHLPPELVDIVVGYGPIFKGEKLRGFCVLDLRDPEVARAYLEDEPHAVQGLLVYSEHEIVATVEDAAFDGDITIVTIPDDVSAKVTRKRMHRDDFGISGIGLLPSGSIVYVNKRGKIVRVKARGQQVDIKSAPTAIDIRGLSSVTLLPRGDELLLNSASGIRTIQSASNGDIVVGQLPYDKTTSLRTMALLDNGKLAYFGGKPAALKILDLENGRTTDLSVEETERVASLIDQRLLAVPARKKGFEVWDLSQENLRKSTKIPRFFATQWYITAIIGLPDGQIIHNGSVVGEKLRALTLFDPETGKSRVLNEKSNVSVLAFDEKNGRLLVGYENGCVEIWR